MGYQRPLASQVYEQLKHDIVSGKLKPGDRIIERVLASQYQASRTPVRHAVQRLVLEGLLTRYGQRTISVTPVTSESIREFYAVRAALEGVAAAAAAEKISNDDLQALTALVQEMEQAARLEDVESSTTVNSLFHQRIMQVSESPLVSSLLDGLKAHTDRFRGYSLGEKSRLTQALVEHQWILRALERRDPHDAQTEMTMHVHRAGLTLLASLKFAPDAKERDGDELRVVKGEGTHGKSESAF